MTEPHYLCPVCGSFASVVDGHGTDATVQCSDCGTRSSEPIVRDRSESRTSGQGMVGRLERADPDDVSAD